MVFKELMLGLQLGLQLVLYGLQRVNVSIAVRTAACVAGPAKS